MTAAPGLLSQAGQATLTGVGEFGDQVVAFLAGSARSATAVGARFAGADAASTGATPAGTGPGSGDWLGAVFETAPGPVVAALWRPFPALCARADDLAFRLRRPWLPVVMDHPHVRVGPLVAPGHGACFGCFQARRRQHDDQRTETAAVLGAYERDAELGPAGHLRHHSRFAAALSAVMLTQFGEAPGMVAGQVVSFNVLRAGVRRHRVVPMPGCPRCGQPRRPGDSDVLAGLAGAIRAGRGRPGHAATLATGGGADAC